MTLDRYILRNFLQSVGLWFVVMMALRTVIDLFVNMDEFAKLGKPIAELVPYIGRYYAYQSLVYFTELGGVILVAGATFALYRMNHTNELTAMLASGVSLYRVVWPILLVSMGFCGLILMDREVLIPPAAAELVRHRDEAPGAGEFDVRLVPDGNASVWYARMFRQAEQNMYDPAVIVRDSARRQVAKVTGSLASPAMLDGQPGWTFKDGKIEPSANMGTWANLPGDKQIYTSLPLATFAAAAASDNGMDVRCTDALYGGMVLTGRCRAVADETGALSYAVENPRFTFNHENAVVGVFTADYAVFRLGRGNESCWELSNGRLFVPSDLTVDDLVLRRSSRWLDYLSVGDLMRVLNLKRVPVEDSVRLAIQTRLVDPINNLVLLLIGLPFIMSRERNVKASAGLCLLTVGTFYAFIYICRYMGLPPVWAAWLPVLLFGPLAAVMVDSIRT